MFKRLDSRWFTKAIRLHLWFFIELALCACCVYVWRRVTHLFNTKNILTFGGMFRVVLFVVLSFSLLASVVGLILVQSDPSLFALVCTVSLGILLFLMTSLVIADVSSFIVRKVICRFVGRKQISKRKLLKDEDTDAGVPTASFRESSDATKRLELKIRTLLALIFALILTLLGFLGISRLAIERVHVPVKGLHHSLNGTTIVQISDIHLGPFIGRQRLSSIVEMVNQLDGDIVVITGDLVDASVADLNEVVKPLANIKSKRGVFYITGKCIILSLY